MNTKVIATVLGTVVAKVARIGVTQTAVQNLQNKNRKDINELNDGNVQMNLKLVSKEDIKNTIPQGKEEMKQGLKTIGLGATKILKVGAQTQAIYSLNETNRDQMKELDGQMRRGYKYNVSPKLQSIKKIKVERS